MENIKREKKIEHIWTIICTSSSVDSGTNNLSLFNVIEEINVQLQAIPGQSIGYADKKNINFQLEIVSLLRKINPSEDVHAEMQIILFGPDKQIMQKSESKIEIKPQNTRLRVITKTNGIQVTSQGDYYFSINLKEQGEDKFKEVATVPFVIKITLPTDLKILRS